MPRNAAILLAAGSGKRMKGAVRDKTLAPLNGRPVFAYSVAAFLESGTADMYVVVYRDHRQMMELAAYAPTPSTFVRGGRRRQDSVALALEALPPDVRTVFIHDCARPLVRPGQIAALARQVLRNGAAALAHRVTDTIKQMAGTPRRPRLRDIDRERLWAMETPQVFERDLICRAHARVRERGATVTDDAAAVELLGRPVFVVENPHPNPKITTAEDLPYLEFLLRQDRRD